MSEEDNKIEKISKISSTVSGTDRIDRFNKIVPNREYFDQLMTQKANQNVQIETTRVDNMKKPTPMEEAQRTQMRIDRGSPTASMNQMLAQADAAVDQINSVKRKLATPNLQLKPSVQNVLRSKLTHIDESLKIALSKVGLDYVPPERPQGLTSPAQKLLGYLTHAQGQIESLSSEAMRLQENKDQLSAGALLGIQMKVGLIQQQLEFFSSVLNKALESTKTIMNVQV